VRRWLKAGVDTEDGLRRSVATGTPQGGLMFEQQIALG
jgi:hypothetical protein